MKRLVFVVAMVCAGPAAAQDADGLFYDFGPTAVCLAESETMPEKLECVGRAADACVEATGYATVVLGGCASREFEDWDARLNAVYQAERAEAREFDMGGSPNAPSLAESLRDMQRAWIGFRDAKCTFARSHWQGGTGGGPATAWCLLYETAEQTLYLQSGGPGQ